MGKLSLSKLIARIGDDKTSVQNLARCMTEVTKTKRYGTIVKFATDIEPELLLSGRIIGLVVWMDREDVNAVMDEAERKPN